MGRLWHQYHSRATRFQTWYNVSSQQHLLGKGINTLAALQFVLYCWSIELPLYAYVTAETSLGSTCAVDC